MNVSATLREAWAAVEASGVPTELQGVAFREAIRLLAPGASSNAPVRADGARGSGGVQSHSNGGQAGGDGTSVISEDQMYARVAAQTGVAREHLERVVHLDDDGPRVSIAGLKLGRNTAERARAVAQLLTITRGFGLEEKETPLEVVRAECDRLKVYDSANFSSHMAALNGYVISGSGRNRRLRAKGPGIAAFPALVDSLLGAE